VRRVHHDNHFAVWQRYLTLRRVEEHERAGVLVATNIKVVSRLLAGASNIVTLPLAPGTTSQQPRTKEGSCCFDLNRPRSRAALLRSQGLLR